MRPHVIVLLSLLQVGVALDFTEWLHQLVLNVADVPQISLNLPVGSAVVDIQSVACHDISLGNLTVESATGSVSGFATNFGLDGLGLKCEVKVQNAEIHVGIPFKSGPLDVNLVIQPGLVSAGLAIPAEEIESAPLPEGANLTACSAPLVLDLVATGTTRLGKKAAGIINAAAAAFTPDFVSSTACGLVRNLVDGRVNETLKNLSSAAVKSGLLIPAEDAAEPDLSTRATNINELLQTGVFGRTLQAIIHHGRYDFSNTTQLLDELIPGFLQVVKPTVQVSDLMQSFHGVGPIPFSFESSMGGLSGGLDLDKCGGGKLPSPLLAGTTTEHAQRFTTGQLDGHCGVDLNFTLNSRVLGLGLGSANISVDFGQLEVTTSLSAALEGLSVYLSLLLGIDGYRMVNEYSTDQWTHPACLTSFLDGADAVNLGFLGLTGAFSSATLNLAALDQDPTLGALLPGVSQMANALLEAYQPALALLLKGSGTSSAVDYLNKKVQNWLTSSNECPPSAFTSPVNRPVEVTSGVWTAVFGGLGLLVATVLLVQCSVRSMRKVEGGQNLLTTSDQQADESGEVSPASTTPLALEGGAVSTTVSMPARWTMNLFLLAAMGLLVIAVALPVNRLQETAMDTDPEGGGVHAQTADKTLEFTIWSLALDLGRFGLPALTALIIIGSVVMPGLQLMGMLACWNLPPSALSVKRRGQILAFLSLTGRSNLLNTFLLAVLAKALRNPFKQTDGVGGTAEFVLEVSPQIGYFVYAAASLASMFLGEIIAQTHFRATESGKKVAASGSGVGAGGVETGDAVTLGAGSGVGAGSSEVLLNRAPLCLLVKGSVLSAVTWLFVLATPVLLIVGLSMHSFSVGQPGCLQGGLKWLLNFPLTEDLSVLTATAGFPWPVQATGALPLQIGYMLVMAILTWFLIVAPVLLSLISVVFWTVPLSQGGHKRAMRLSEFMFNWQALELFVAIIIVLTLLDTVLSQVLDAVVSNTSALSGICTSLTNGPGVMCISLDLNMLPGMAVLVAAVLSNVASRVLVGYQAKGVLGE